MYRALHELCYVYTLSGDQSGSDSHQQAIVDETIRQIIDMEDTSVLPDLRLQNQAHSDKYESFWDECEKFLNESVGVAVDDRRHGAVTHLARVISVRDFLEQVKGRCPKGTPIPSQEWLRLQFWPKTASSKTSLHHTRRFKVKFQIQQRQWKKYHIDAHYAAAYFR